MSIADDEAEKAYPTRYWDGTHVKEQFYCDTDDLQEAYLRGRNAPPADAEVEAVAKRLLWDSCEWDGVDSYAAKDEEDAWDYAGRFPPMAGRLYPTSQGTTRTGTEGGKRMSRIGKTETLAIAAAVLFSVLFFALVAYLGWAEATANTIILRDGSRSYTCQTSRISQTPHNCKPVKEES